MSNGVTRRSALVGAVVTVAGGVLGFVYGRNSDAKQTGASPYGYGGQPTAPAGKKLAELADVPDGGGLIGGGVVITRSGNDVHAFSSTCTHLGCTVNKVSGGKIFCPCHGSVFSATTGAVIDPPAPSPLPVVTVTVMDGGIYTS